MIRPIAFTLAAFALLAAPALAAPPTCVDVDRELARIDSRLRAIAANQDADAVLEGAGGLAAGLTFGASWLAAKAATAGLETNALPAAMERSMWAGAGLALGCKVEPYVERRAAPAAVVQTPQHERGRP